MVSVFAQTTPVAMVTKNWEFYHKICHNLVAYKIVVIFGSMVWFMKVMKNGKAEGTGGIPAELLKGVGFKGQTRII